MNDTGRMLPRQVLLCDDAEMFAAMLHHWFEDDPEIDVVGVAGSAREGLSKAAELQPDVIVLDHLLPDGNSAQVIPQLRSRAPAAAVVLVSGLVGEVLARAAAAAGAEGWCSKASTQEAIRREILSVECRADPAAGA